jgi:hypothetical protein
MVIQSEYILMCKVKVVFCIKSILLNVILEMKRLNFICLVLIFTSEQTVKEQKDGSEKENGL